MDVDVFPETLKLKDDLNRYLSACFDEPIDLAEICSCTDVANTIQAHGKSIDLYLRIVPNESKGWWSDKTIVIANLRLRDQRVGHGRDFVEFLHREAWALDYPFVGIENANVFSSAFALRLEFMEYKIPNCYIRSVSD